MGKQIKPSAFQESLQNNAVTANSKRTLDLDFTKPNSLTKSKGIVDTSRGSTAEAIYENPFEEGFFNPKFLGFDLGPVDESAYDTLGFNNPFNSNIDFEKIRADKQSTISKLGANTTQFLGKTTVGIVGNIIGSLYGLGAVIGTGDKSQLFDNKIFRSLDEANEAIEAKNTIFLNRKKGIGLNMETFKDVTDAFSFIASAVGSELIMQSAGNVLGGTGLATLSGRMGRYLRGAQKLSKQLDNAQDLERLALELGTTVDKLAKHKRNLDLMNASVGMGRRILTTTGYEASLEARQTKDDFIRNMEERVDAYLKNASMTDKEKENYKANFMTKAETDADKAAMLTFGLNTALLSASNMMQFPSIFGSSYLKAKKLYDLERTGLNTVQKAKKGNKFTRGLYNGVRLFKNPITEFTEETLQKTFGETSQSYYEHILSTETNGDVLTPAAQNFGSAMWEGLKEAYGTSEGLHEGFIGAIVGAIGLPGFKKVGNKTKFQWNGGIPGDIREIREKADYTTKAINSLNELKMSDVVNYKKDNAILSTIDANKEENALDKGSKIEFEDVQNNKVFRYVTDKLKKGVEEHIKEDIDEMRSMDLDTYRKTFQKDDNFTEEDKNKEINEFNAKTDIYSKAFKIANKNLDFGMFQYDNIVFNKLNDILTHSIATEKIYGEKLENLKQKIVGLNLDLSEDDINKYTVTAGKLVAARKEIDEYIKLRNKEINKKSAKENNTISDIQKALKEKLDSRYSYLLDVDTIGLKEQKEILEKTENLSEEFKIQLDNINKALELKEDYDKTLDKNFDAKKSSIVRKKEENYNNLLKEINNKIKQEVSLATKELGALPKKVTLKELNEYLDLKKKIGDYIQKRNDSTHILDQQDLDLESKDILDEIEDITYRLMNATEIAASLYKLKNQPEKIYAKGVVSDLFANIENARKKAIILEFYRMNNSPVNELKPMVQDLQEVLDIINKKYNEASPYLNKDSKNKVSEIIKFIEQVLERFDGYVKTEKKVEKQKKQAKQTIIDDSDDLDLTDDLDRAGILDDSEEVVEKDTNKNKKTLDKKFNRLLIKETKADGTPQLSNPEFPSLQEAIADGIIKNKAASTLKLNEDNIYPEKNQYLKNLLEKENLLDQYNKGYTKLKNNIDLLKNINSDEDINTFVRFAPITINVYDKIADKKDNHYEFEIEEGDNIIYQQYLYIPDNFINKFDELSKKEQEYEEEVEKLKDWKKEQLKNKTTTVNNINQQYQNKVKELEQKYFEDTWGSYSNLDMRKELLKNYFSGNNELKLKVHNIDQGDFESFKDNIGGVEENNVEELGYNANDIHIHDIVYTDRYGKYTTLDGVKVNDISDYKETKNPHPLQEMGAGNSNEIYFNYETKNDKIVPIKMNMKRLSPKDVNLILDTFEKFILSPNKDEFFIKVKDSDNPVLAKEKNLTMEDFLSFFLKTKRGKTNSPLFVKNTFNLNTKGLKDNQIAFQVLNEGVAKLELIFPPADGSNNQEIIDIFNENKEELRSILLKQRHNFNRNFFYDSKTKDLKRDNLKYMFDERIINHPFNVNNNFDKIFDPEYNKNISLSRADIDDVASSNIKKPTIGKVLRDLRVGLTSKSNEGNYEGNLYDVYTSVINGIKRSITLKLNNRDINDLSSKDKEELIKESINTILNDRINKVLEAGNNYPGSLFTPTLDHENNTKIEPSDKILDQVLKILYEFKNDKLSDKKYIKALKDRVNHWNSLGKLLNEFRYPPAGANFSMLNFVPNSDGNEVRTSITNEQQLESFLRIINVLKELTDSKGIDYIDINYTEAFYGNNKIYKNTHKFTSAKNLSESELTNAHHKTRLKSVQIEEQPKWENGELVEGEIYFNFGKKNKDGKIGNQKVLVLSASKGLKKSTNIMTSISLPFISLSTFQLDNNLDSMLKDALDNIGEDLAARNIALNKFNLPKETKVTTASLFDEDADDTLDLSDSIAKANEEHDNFENSKVDSTNNTLDPKNLDSKLSTRIFQSKMPHFEKRFREDNLNEERKEKLLNDLKTMNITNLSQYLFALDYYNKQEKMEYSENFIKFGEYLFNEKREDCK